MNIKNFIYKLRIFKRIKDLTYRLSRFRKENNQLKDQMIFKRKVITELKSNIMKQNEEYSKLSEKKDKASKHVVRMSNARKELESRRDEFLNRMKSKIPDDIIGGRFEDYKYWLAEPFIIKEFTRHMKVKEGTTFIDSFAAYRGISKVLDDEEKRKE